MICNHSHQPCLRKIRLNHKHPLFSTTMTYNYAFLQGSPTIHLKNYPTTKNMFGVKSDNDHKRARYIWYITYNLQICATLCLPTVGYHYCHTSPSADMKISRFVTRLYNAMILAQNDKKSLTIIFLSSQMSLCEERRCYKHQCS